MNIFSINVSSIVDSAGTRFTGLDAGISGAYVPPGAGGAQVDLLEATANGTDTMSLVAPTTLTANRSITLSDRDFDLTDIAVRAEQITRAGVGVPSQISLPEDTANGTDAYVVRAPSAVTAGGRVEVKPDANVTWPSGAGGVVTPMDLESAQTVTGTKTMATPLLTNPTLAGTIALTGTIKASDIFRGTAAVAAGANSVAHGLAKVPTIFFLSQMVGHNGAGGPGTQLTTITAGPTADGTNVDFTATEAGGTVLVTAF